MSADSPVTFLFLLTDQYFHQADAEHPLHLVCLGLILSYIQYKHAHSLFDFFSFSLLSLYLSLSLLRYSVKETVEISRDLLSETENNVYKHVISA